MQLLNSKMRSFKNSILLLLSILFIQSCSSNKYKEILSGKNGFYWDVIQDADRKFIKPGYCYFFDINGGCIYYAYMRYPNQKVKRVKFDYGDVVYSQKWKLNSDTLEIQGFNNKIVSIAKDEIVLIVQNKTKDTLILKKSNFIE